MANWLARAHTVFKETPNRPAANAAERTVTESNCLSLIDGTPRYRWRVSGPKCGAFEVCCLPEMTADEMRACYPGATLMPLPDKVGEAFHG